MMLNVSFHLFTYLEITTYLWLLKSPFFYEMTVDSDT